jgi:pimeloyl-ACP methyl ester carboxylesterase
MKKKWVWPGLWSVALIFAAGFALWAAFPLGPAPEALSALQSDNLVEVSTMPNMVVFIPQQLQPQTGLIFYPGGRVDYRSYAPPLKEIAEAGYLVVLPQMPLSLAVFDPGRAEEVITAYPQIENWVIGGHSLGGAMATGYIHKNLDRGYGLMLWASYPAASNDLSAEKLPVLSIYGTRDMSVEKLVKNQARLPDSTEWVVIEGGNHAQFGNYGEQPGDQTPQISSERQQRLTVEAAIHFLESFETRQ